VRAICAAEVDPMRLTERDTKTYCALVGITCDPERRLVVAVVDADAGIGADVEAPIPLEGHGQGFSHGFGGDHLAIHLEDADARAAAATDVV
jgi:hypothetical protein